MRMRTVHSARGYIGKTSMRACAQQCTAATCAKQLFHNSAHAHTGMPIYGKKIIFCQKSAENFWGKKEKENKPAAPRSAALREAPLT